METIDEIIKTEIQAEIAADLATTAGQFAKEVSDLDDTIQSLPAPPQVKSMTTIFAQILEIILLLLGKIGLCFCCKPKPIMPASSPSLTKSAESSTNALTSVEKVLHSGTFDKNL